jgi:ribosomal protein L22
VKVWDEENPDIYIPNEHKSDPNPTWKAQKFNITYSSHKLALCAWTIRKMHLYDAIETITSVDKKGGPLVKSVLEAARHNGVKQGFSEERMFVKSITVGRAQGPKKIDIKGRGKMGFIRAPITSICLTMEEKGPEDMFKMIM